MIYTSVLPSIGLAALYFANFCSAQIGPPGWQGAGVYAVYNVGTNTSMDLAYGNQTNSAPIEGFSNNWIGNQHQLWFAIGVQVSGVNDTIAFFNNGTNFCTVAAIAAQSPVTCRTDLQVADYRMIWARESTTISGAYQFRNLRWSGQYLDMDHTNPAPGTPVNCWPRNTPDTSNQQWYLQLVAKS